MNLREVIRFEFNYQLRSASTWLIFAVLLVFAALMIRGVSIPEFSDTGILITAPSTILSITIFGSAIWLMISGVVAGEAASRDIRTRMHPLVYASPVNKIDYLGGRFLAALLLNALILLAIPLGILLGTYLPGVDPLVKGELRPAAYLAAYGFFALPNAFVITAIQFSSAMLSKRGVTAYLGSWILLFISHIGVGGLGEALNYKELSPRLDLVGIIGTWAYLDRTWVLIEKNTRLLLPEGDFLVNRLVWTGIAVLALAFTYYRFRFTHAAAGKRERDDRRKNTGDHTPAPVAEANPPVAIKQVHREFGLVTQLAQIAAVALDSFGNIFNIRSALLFLGVFILPVFIFVSGSINPLGIPLIPATGRLIDVLAPSISAMRTPLILVPFLLIYYAGELVWRERETGISEIIDTSPVPARVLFAGKFLGLGLLVMVWLAILLGDGLLVQLDRGYHHHEIGLYLKVLFGIQLTNYLLFALIVLVIHVLAGQKYLGHMLALVVYAFIAGSSAIGIKHHLLVYSTDPGWEYTEMYGFGNTLGPWLWFKAYWAGWAILLAVLAILFWPHGRNAGIRTRVKLLRSRFTGATKAAAFVGLAVILGTGSFIFYNTNILNSYNSAADDEAHAVRYEQLYGRYKNIPQPLLKHVHLFAELYPERGEAEIRGTYTLLNNQATPVNAIHLVTVPGVETGDIAFNRPASPVVSDKAHAYLVYALKKPLQPGDSLALSFTVKIARHGFRNSGANNLVAVNGIYLRNQDCLPSIGYQTNRELAGVGRRKKYGLSPRRALPSLYDVEARKISSGFNLVNFEATVGTTNDQTGVAPGKLLQTWKKNSRNYARYRTSTPIQNQFALFSGRYAVKEGVWTSPVGKTIAIRIFHHPGHPVNVERMLKSTRASLDFYTQKFGPYPYSHLTIVERGDSGNSLHAEASMIAYSETYALFDPNDGPNGFDLPYYAMAHEVAHQWWGAAQLRPARAEGIPFLAEGLAVYSGMQVLEKSYGPVHMNKYLQFLRDSYEQPRTRAAVPLLRAGDPFAGYRKGPLALYALSQYTSWDKVNLALRQLLVNTKPGAYPLPTTLDLYKELKTVTPDSLHYLLHDLFEANTFWEFKMLQASSKQVKTGDWQLTLELQARKAAVDPAGTETEIPMNDWIEIGLFDENGTRSFLQKCRIRSGKQTITVMLKDKPSRAVIDPNQLLIDLETKDNGATVKVN